MKPLLACLAILATLNVTAQIDGFQLPYNPDIEPDGYIGVSDVLALLPLFGQEFDAAISLSPDSSSILTLGGNSSSIGCYEVCSQLGSAWNLAKFSDLGEHWTFVLANSASYAWTRSWREHEGFVGLPLAVHTSGDVIGDVATISGWVQGDCFCVAHERPKVEYTFCEGVDSFGQCASQKVAEGWYPLTGTSQISYYGPHKFQAFWRWVD